jgi:hypothetical protein
MRDSQPDRSTSRQEFEQHHFVWFWNGLARFGPTSMRKPLSRPERDDCGTCQTSIRRHPPRRSAMRVYAVAPIQYRSVALRHVGPRDATCVPLPISTWTASSDIETNVEHGCFLKSIELRTAATGFHVTRLTEASFIVSTPKQSRMSLATSSIRPKRTTDLSGSTIPGCVSARFGVGPRPDRVRLSG